MSAPTPAQGGARNADRPGAPSTPGHGATPAEPRPRHGPACTGTVHGAQAAILAAVLAMMVGMGIGRFAFTGLYPAMVADGQMSVAAGSWAASANYAGYLAGALLAVLPHRLPDRPLWIGAAIATGVLTVLLALDWPDGGLIVLRGFAGVASAVVMVAASHWLLQTEGQVRAAPLLYGGVGLGILVSAEGIALGRALGLGSREIWLWLGIGALGLVALAVVSTARFGHGHARRREAAGPGRRDTSATGPAVPLRMTAGGGARQGGAQPLRAGSETRGPESVDPEGAAPGALRLTLIYGLAGLGYILTATYLPLMAQEALPGLDPAHVWAVFGLGAMPSCLLWHRLALRLGTGRGLCLNLSVQALGVLLPLTRLPGADLASALLVGGTFLGTVTIAMPAARRAAAGLRVDIFAVMTASYGAGQAAGPVLAEALRGLTGGLDAALGLGGGVLVLGALLCVPRGRAN